MDIFNVLTMTGGLCLFLFGMSVMGQALERRAGGSLRSLLGRMTSGKLAGLLTGLGITAVIQSSSATTVMVVGFVNSGLMTLRQAINVIMGANIGTTVTAWILSLAGIDTSNTLVRLLKPSSFVPVLSLAGIILYMFGKNGKKKDTGTILLGFATLMFGMETMSQAVSGLKNIPGFTNLFVMFQNPISGVLAGAVLTAVIQSSSASVGILQALSLTGAVSFGAAIPIIMGQNIGTCITALLSSIGANRNAKRAAFVHLSFNIIGTLVCLFIFVIMRGSFADALSGNAFPFGIAVAHSVFNVFCTVVLLPLSGVLEKAVMCIIPDKKVHVKETKLDERLLMTPPVALERCRETAGEMAMCAISSVSAALSALDGKTADKNESIVSAEALCDSYEDMLGTYLVKLSALPISVDDSREAAMLLKAIGDFERISDHAVSIMNSADELKEKGMSFSAEAKKELSVLTEAVNEILRLTLDAFINKDIKAAYAVQPLRQVIDLRKEQLRRSHISRLQQNRCSIAQGFVWCDLLTDFERIAAHCSNIADCTNNVSNPHASGMELRDNSADYRTLYSRYDRKFALE